MFFIAFFFWIIFKVANIINFGWNHHSSFIPMLTWHRYLKKKRLLTIEKIVSFTWFVPFPHSFIQRQILVYRIHSTHSIEPNNCYTTIALVIQWIHHCERLTVNLIFFYIGDVIWISVSLCISNLSVSSCFFRNIPYEASLFLFPLSFALRWIYVSTFHRGA